MSPSLEGVGDWLVLALFGFVGGIIGAMH